MTWKKILPKVSIMPFLRSFLYTNKGFLYALILLIATSCSLTVPQSSMYAFDPGTGRKHSHTYVSKEYSYETEGLGNEHKALAFNINVTNSGLDSLIFDPKEWSLLYSNQKTTIPKMKSIRPIAPAQVADMYHELSLKAKANRDIGIAVGVVLIVGLFVLILAAEEAVDQCPADCNHCETDYFNYAASGVTIGTINHASEDVALRSEPADFKTQSDYFNYKRMMVAKEEFSPTVLRKGESREFKLFFPRVDGMTHLKLIPPPGFELEVDKDSWFVHHLIIR